MQFYQKHKKLFGISAAVVFSSGLGWIALQIHKARHTINNAVDTSIIDLLEPKSTKGYREDDDPFLTKLFKRYKNFDLLSPAAKWKSLNYLFAQRLIAMSKTDVKGVRKRAIFQLSKVSNLESWQYPVLANLCDAKTAVSLSRMENLDLRLIKEPPQRHVKLMQENVVKTMRELLINLNLHSDHICMEFFLERAFPFHHEESKYVDHDYPYVGLSKMIESTSNILPLCVESILHHSSIDEYARDIAKQNALPLLMEIYKMYPENVEVNVSICKILANISIFPEFLDELFNTGWIRVLAEWARGADLRLSLPAIRALTNLDPDKDIQGLYPRSVYLLHPKFSSFEKTHVDVIFIHGLLGGVLFTWRQRLQDKETIGLIGKQREKGRPRVPFSNSDNGANKVLLNPTESITNESTSVRPPIKTEFEFPKTSDSKIHAHDWECDFEYVLYDLPINGNEEGKGPYTFPCNKMKKPLSGCYSQCWPKDWLPEDCNHLRIIGINYDTNLSMWAPICPREHLKTTIEERSNEFMAKLVKAGVGERPIIWVTHSMGGLLVKNILCKAWDSDVRALKNMVKQTKSIVFYSTPHTGSRVANVSPPTSYVLWPSVEVQELRQESPGLKEIHKKFQKLVNSNPMKIISFVETKPILVTALKFNFLLVEPESGNPGIGEYFEIPQDHLGICKPKNKHSFLYQKVLHIIRSTVNEEKKYGYSFLEEKNM